MEEQIQLLKKQLDEIGAEVAVLRAENDLLRRTVNAIDYARREPHCFVCGQIDHAPGCYIQEASALRARFGKVYGCYKGVQKEKEE